MTSETFVRIVREHCDVNVQARLLDHNAALLAKVAALQSKLDRRSEKIVDLEEELTQCKRLLQKAATRNLGGSLGAP